MSIILPTIRSFVLMTRVRSLIQRGELTAVCVGDRPLVPRSELVGYVERNLAAAKAEARD